MEDGNPDEPQEQLLVGGMIIGLHKSLHALIEQLLVDAHEERLDVEFHHPAVLRITMAALPDHLLHPLLSIEGTLATATTVTVVDEVLLHQCLQLVDDEMMNDAIPKLGGKHLSAYWLGYHKGDILKNKNAKNA